MPVSHGKMTDGNMGYERTIVVCMHDRLYVPDVFCESKDYVFAAEIIARR